MMTMKLKLKRSTHRDQVRIRFNAEKLNDPNVAATFQAQLVEKFAALKGLIQDIDSFTNDFNEAIRSTADEVMGKRKSISDDAPSVCEIGRELSKS